MTRIISLLNESEIRKIISNYENEDFETISKCLVVLKNRHNSSVGVGVIDNICKHFNKRNYDELIGNSVLSNSQSKFCSNCGGNVSDSIKFCPSCGSQVVKLIKLEESNKKSTNSTSIIKSKPNKENGCLIPLIGIGLFIIFFISIQTLNWDSILNSNSKKIEGLWECPFPRTKIEFQSSGGVIISPFYGNRQTPSCVTEGTWEKINDNEVKVTIKHNPNCQTDDFGGVYKIEDGKNFDGSKTQILTSGIMKFEKK